MNTMEPELPAMLYRPGSMFVWDGERFDYLIVATGDELAEALAKGWSLGKPVPEKTLPRKSRARKQG